MCKHPDKAYALGQTEHRRGPHAPTWTHFVPHKPRCLHGSVLFPHSEEKQKEGAQKVDTGTTKPRQVLSALHSQGTSGALVWQGHVARGWEAGALRVSLLSLSSITQEGQGPAIPAAVAPSCPELRFPPAVLG